MIEIILEQSCTLNEKLHTRVICSITCYLEYMTVLLKQFQSFLIPSFLVYKVVAVNVFFLLAEELKPAVSSDVSNRK